MEFDFSSNTSVADINKVPQDFRGLYKQDGDKHVLDSENPGVKSAISVITGLNTALKAARLEAKNKPGVVDLTPLKDFGTTPAEILEKFKEKETELTNQIKGVNIDKIRKDLAAEWEPKVNAATSASKSLEGQLHEELVVSKATSAIATEKGEVDLLMPFVKQHVKTIVADGKYVVRVVDASGDVRFSGVTGKEMSIAELVKEMKANEKYGRLFASDAKQGGGAPPTGTQGRNAATGNGSSVTELSATQKISRGLAAGLAKKAR